MGHLHCNILYTKTCYNEQLYKEIPVYKKCILKCHSLLFKFSRLKVNVVKMILTYQNDRTVFHQSCTPQQAF